MGGRLLKLRADMIVRLLMVAGCAATLALTACGANYDGLQDNRYQLAKTQPGALQNPKAAPDTKLAEGPFARWAAVIVAGDDASAGGGTTQAFDNARRDLAKAFVAAGFDPNHIMQYSSDPKDGDPTNPGLANVDAVKGGLQRMLGVAGDGCLIYVTSHGNTQGIKFGEKLASTADIAGLGDKTCGGRPTVMVMSACHSGIFVQPLSAPNRLVMTAARSDRSSFGCGTDNKYPYFDECMIESLPHAPNFVALTSEVKACVSRMETAGHFQPPSEPQFSIGADIQPTLIADGFHQGGATTVMACTTTPTNSCPAGPSKATLPTP
jgi:Peptidase C13 family